MAARSAFSALARPLAAATRSSAAFRLPALVLQRTQPAFSPLSLRFAGSASGSTNEAPEAFSAVQGSEGAPVAEVDAQDARAETSSAPRTQNDLDKRTVYVGRLSFNVDHAWLKEEFASVGEIVNSRIITDRDGGSRGFGYVEFARVEDAQEALRHDGKEIDGRPIRVDISTPRTPRAGYDTVARPRRPPVDLPASSTLYVGNLPFTVTDSQLSEAFAARTEQDAPIVSIRVPLDGMTGKPRGFAYVEFGDTATAQANLQRHQEDPIVINGREARLGFSTPRNTYNTQRRDGGGDSKRYGERGGPSYGARTGSYGGSAQGFGRRDREQRNDSNESLY